MQTEIIDNIDLEENAAPPLPPTPHFDEQGIAAAKPVEPLRARRSYNVQWSRLWRRHLGLLAIVAFGLLFASSVAVALIELHLQPQSTSETNVAAGQPVVDADSSEPVADSSDKKLAELSDKKQADSGRPDTAGNDQSANEMRNNETHRNFMRTYHPARVRDRLRFPMESDDMPFMIVERAPDGTRRARLVTVIH